MKLISKILALIATVVFCAPSYGQIGGGSIYGKVLDREGKALQGAVIQVEHLSTHQTDDTKTGKSGAYSLSGLYQGQYKVTLIVNGRAAMMRGEGTGNAIYVASGLEVAVNFDLRNAPATPPPTPVTAPSASGGSKGDDKAKAADEKKDAQMRASFTAGVAALKANNNEEAITQFKAAAEKDPSQPGVFQNLGLALTNVKKYDEAAAAYRKAIELKPDDAGFYASLSSVLADAGKLDEAAQPLEQAVKLNPQVAAQGYYNLGIDLTNRGKSKEAVGAFNKAIELDAKNAKAYYQLGIAYFGSADTIPQAVTALEKFLQLNSTGPDAEAAKQLIEAAKAQLKK